VAGRHERTGTGASTQSFSLVVNHEFCPAFSLGRMSIDQVPGKPPRFEMRTNYLGPDLTLSC